MNKTTPTSITVAFTGKTVRLPQSADAWELYASMPGAEAAARRLTEALVKALRAPTRADAIKIMSAALKLESKFGAYDTEPCYHAETLLQAGRGDDFSYCL